MTIEGHASPLRLALVGGGFTGAVLAMNAIRATRRPLIVTVIEPAAELGRGIAYGTDDPAHRINVPSDRMSLFKDEPLQATNWLRAQGLLEDPACHDGQGHFYVPRAAYGDFVRSALEGVLDRAGRRVHFAHRQTIATDLSRNGPAWSVATQDGEPVQADVVALCFGHAVPSLPCRIASDVHAHPKFVPDPWAKEAHAAVAASDSVLIVGTGLTMADVVVSLIERGHRGPITAISRRGLLPRSHGAFRSDYDLFEDRPVPRTASGLLRLVRERIRRDGEAQGWQPIVDALRFKLPLAWGGLPAGEKRKVLRRLLPIWDVHRFRIAPQVHAALQDVQRLGQLDVERASVAHLTRAGGRFAARLKRPGHGIDDRCFDAVILCTGPEKDPHRNPLAARLLTSGLARLDEAGLGLAVDATSRVLDQASQPWPSLLAFGPMTRGTFGEMTGAPDIAAHIERVVPRILEPTESGPVDG